jgi:mannose-6-phosphate isomerase-like protein (cupin superfamily)
MKIGMLSPIAWRTPPRNYGPWESTVSVLTEGLVQRGIDVTLFATRDSLTQGKLAGVSPSGYEEDRELLPKVWECLHISELFERGDEFDLIHNHLDFLPLTYMRMTNTPVLTTIHRSPSPETLPVYKKYNGRAYYVAISEADRNPELNYIGTIHHGTAERMVDDYLRVYERILGERKREDHRPWGFYEVLADRPEHKVKRITVYPGQRLSYQRHFQRSEHWYVIQGRAVVTLNGQEIEAPAGEAIDLPVGSWHRVRNPGESNLVFIEVQTGEYFGEDDIERAEDDYGRV